MLETYSRSAGRDLPAQQRAAERFAAGLAGTIVFSARYVPLPCTVWDISETGARLQVENVNQVPSPFRLKIQQTDIAVECVVVWRGKSEVGVMFQTAYW